MNCPFALVPQDLSFVNKITSPGTAAYSNPLKQIYLLLLSEYRHQNLVATENGILTWIALSTDSILTEGDIDEILPVVILEPDLHIQ